MCKSIVLECAAVMGVLCWQAGHAWAADPAALRSTDPVASGLTVLTYNTHLFKGSTAVLGATATLKDVVFDDDDRSKHIASRLEKSGADIVALQEVWDFKRQDWFKDRLKSTYPYSYRASAWTGRFGPKEKDILREIGKTTSGLVLLCKYKLKDLKFHPFPDERTSKRDEHWATKGVITATVEPWPGGPTFRGGSRTPAPTWGMG